MLVQISVLCREAAESPESGGAGWSVSWIDVPEQVRYASSPMTGLRSLLPLVLLGLFVAPASAQIDVRLQMSRNTFVAGEPVPVSISVTNNSGQDLVFQGNSRFGWIDFTVTSNRGVPMTPLGQPTFGAVKIQLGQTMTKTIDIARLFMRRLTITGSTLRPRSIEFKAAIASRLRETVWPLLESGAIKPVIYKTFPLAQAAEAHALMESSAHIGKIMLAT